MNEKEYKLLHCTIRLINVFSFKLILKYVCILITSRFDTIFQMNWHRRKAGGFSVPILFPISLCCVKSFFRGYKLPTHEGRIQGGVIQGLPEVPTPVNIFQLGHSDNVYSLKTPWSSWISPRPSSPPTHTHHHPPSPTPRSEIWIRHCTLNTINTSTHTPSISKDP